MVHRFFYEKLFRCFLGNVALLFVSIFCGSLCILFPVILSLSKDNNSKNALRQAQRDKQRRLPLPIRFS